MLIYTCLFKYAFRESFMALFFVGVRLFPRVDQLVSFQITLLGKLCVTLYANVQLISSVVQLMFFQSICLLE